MRPIEDKEIPSGSTINFEFHKGNKSSAARGGSSHHPQTVLRKQIPSKWDDAQKWLAGLSRGGGGGDRRNHHHTSSKTKPRNSNADDTRLIAPVPQHEIDYPAAEDPQVVHQTAGENVVSAGSLISSLQCEVQTKDVDCNEESYWRINKAVDSSNIGGVRSVCVRDMGTEMTPIVSQEPSRTTTPIRARTPVRRSPIASGCSTPIRFQPGGGVENYVQDVGPNPAAMDNSRGGQASPLGIGRGNNNGAAGDGDQDLNTSSCRAAGSNSLELGVKTNPLETRALAWDEAERAKYMARYKREEIKIEAWENHEKRKAEMEMKKMEAKAERLKARAQEKYANKLASTRRIAEEKRAHAEAKLNEKAVNTSEKADYIRRTGHLPSTFSFKPPSFCW